MRRKFAFVALIVLLLVGAVVTAVLLLDRGGPAGGPADDETTAPAASRVDDPGVPSVRLPRDRVQPGETTAQRGGDPATGSHGGGRPGAGGPGETDAQPQGHESPGGASTGPGSAASAPGDSGAAAPDTPQGTGEVMGRVLSSASGEPVEGVTVTLRWVTGPERLEDRSATTDLVGGFRFDEVALARYVVIASLEGYADRRSPTLDVPRAGARREVELLLATGGTIEGRVLDENGAPVAGARIGLIRGNPTVHAGATTTDEDGWYRFENLLPEHYTVEVQRGQWDRQSEYVQLDDGQVIRLDFRSEAWVSGVVLLPDGTPLEDALVTAWFSGPPLVSRKAQSDAEGHYRLDGMKPGKWELKVQVLGDAGFAASAGSLEVAPGRNDHTIRVEGGEIAGKIVVGSTGQPPSPRSIQITASPVQRAGAFDSAMAFAKPDGTYTFKGLRAGRYRIRVDPHVGSLRALVHEVDLNPGQRLHGVDLVLESVSTGLVRIEVRDEAGKPLEGLYAAVLVGETWVTGPTPSPAPGVYALRLETGARSIMFSRPGFEASIVEVEVVEGETTTAEITLLPAPDEPPE